ncbi:MAG: DUF429 domain-containing protein [Thermoleophilia bacterium]
MWAGVDVGDTRKGFHYALLGRGDGVEIGAVRDAAALSELLSVRRVELVAVDSPIAAAPLGERSRLGERLLASRKTGVCGIRWTPDMSRMEGRRSYYGWILNGLLLYAELERSDIRAVECFPTASWTRLIGKRGSCSRAAWTSAGLARLRLAADPSNQDERDAVMAALTARLCAWGLTESFGTIVVPLAGALDAARARG